MSTTDDEPETIALPHGLTAILLPAEEPISIPKPFHISPRRAAHYTDQLPDDDPGVELFTQPAPTCDGPEPWA